MRSKYIRRNDLVEVHEDARETSKEEVLRLTNWSTGPDARHVDWSTLL